MVRNRKWFWSGAFVALALCTTGLLGCAAGGGGGGEGEGEGEDEAGLAVNFSGAAGGNSAVAQDEDGNEYTFRQNDEGQLVEANIRMADTGQTVKASMDSEGRPVKYRATDGTHADVFYDGDMADMRYHAAGEEAGSAQEATGIDSTAAKQRVLMRRAAHNEKRAVAMQQEQEEEIRMLQDGLSEFEVRTESLFEDPDSPLHDSPLEDPCLRIARIASTMSVREVGEEELADVDLDEVPDLIAELAGRDFELFDAEGYCITERGEVRIRSVLTFDSHGNLMHEVDRKFLFDLPIGGIEAERPVHWESNTRFPLTVPGADFSAWVTPVFTGTQLDDNGFIVVERRFLAEFEYPQEQIGEIAVTPRDEVLFNAAFVNGELSGNIFECDLILIDLANETEPRRLARLRYYDQNMPPRPGPDKIMFPCVVSEGDQPEGAGSGLKCPTSAEPYQWFTVELTDREAAADPDRARRLQYEWYVSSGYGYIENPFEPVATVVPTSQGLLEISLIVSDPSVSEEFNLYVCEVRVGEITVEGSEYLDCPVSMNVSQPDYFYLAGGDATAAGPRQAIGDVPQTTGGDGSGSVEWFVFGTSDFLVDDPYSPETDITFYESGRFEVWAAVYRPDGTEAYASCEVSVDAAGFDECAEFGWYQDGICDEFCPLPDQDCRGAQVSDWCEDAGYYGDGVCDPDCPQPDSDCAQFDWCDELGWYGDGFCDEDCPQADPDCATFDVCEENGWYADGLCDDFCPLFDPDCQLAPGVQDICEDLGYYSDGICDEFCPALDPDCLADDGVATDGGEM